MASQYYVASWNLENLFDTEDAPRTDKVRRAIGKDIVGWNANLLNRKVSQLASIIRKMNNGAGPDVLGVCEVENEHVLKMLIEALAPLGRKYGFVHHESPDTRGIDVALIYDEALFTTGKVFDCFVVRRTATRDILQVTLKTTVGNHEFIVLVNHWPSRSGGAPEVSASYRAIAGETLAYFHQRIHDELGGAIPVLAMGDFNDEPFDSSLEENALSTRSRTKVMNGHNPYFLNLMWPLVGRAEGTLYYEGAPNLFDQFLADRPMVTKDAPISVVPDSAEIVRFPEMQKPGKPQPIRFGGMGQPVNQDGFSDHFPVALKILVH